MSTRANPSRRVLLIRNRTASAAQVRHLLGPADGEPLEVEWVRHCSEGLERLALDRRVNPPSTARIAAVLVDLFLPDSQGIVTFDQLFLAAPNIPIFVLSAPQHEEAARLAVRRGARAYFLGPRAHHRLPDAPAKRVARAAQSASLFEEREQAQVILDSISDAVISTDLRGNVLYMNSVAARLTGWSEADAVGCQLEQVFQIIDAATREAVCNPMAVAIRDNRRTSLKTSCLLIRRDGAEFAIEDSAVPVHDLYGQVSGGILAFHDVSVTRTLTLSLSHLTHHDGLTDLPNRTMFSERLTRTIVFARRHRHTVGVLLLDLNGFKHINESLGHAVGDQLLQSVARRLLECVRGSETVCRREGHEFAILLPEMASALDADALAQRVLRTLSAVHHIDTHQLYVTPNLGIASYPDDGTDAEELVSHAEIAKCEAQASGRNNYRFFKSGMDARAIARRVLEAQLCRAAERQEFQLHYQSKVMLRSATVVGAEALIRWHHPERGPVPPSQFIPIAETCGFITTLGRWVLREACRQNRAWQDAGFPSLCMAVNVSAVELCDKTYVDTVAAVLAETGLDPGHLELELTETFLMQDSQAAETVVALKNIGVRIALDDFGTGYSSLSYLKRFPIDTLKIDRSFISNITTDPGDACIAKAVIGMGAGLHMRVVAEGVETREQLTKLQEMNCPEGQGYYFSHPVGAVEFAELLRRPQPAGVQKLRVAAPAGGARAGVVV
jgi:diguanylate cyclase (GGDEF)-like protein/PAS domain S-box-containing protein